MTTHTGTGIVGVFLLLTCCASETTPIGFGPTGKAGAGGAVPSSGGAGAGVAGEGQGTGGAAGAVGSGGQGTGGAAGAAGAGGNPTYDFAAMPYDTELDCFWDSEAIDTLYYERQLEDYQSSTLAVVCVISPTGVAYVNTSGGELAIVEADPNAGWRVPEWFAGSSAVFYYDAYSSEEWALCQRAWTTWGDAYQPNRICTNAEQAAGGASSTDPDLGSPITLIQDVWAEQPAPGSERIVWGGTDCGVVAVEGLTARCEQALCGFVSSDNGTAHVLVRPCDMDPEEPMQSLCTTRVEFDAPEGATTVDVSQQPDNLNGAQPSVLIGTAQCSPAG